MKIITLTDSAKEMMLKLVEGDEETGIRIGIKGGGCSGLSYHMDLDSEKELDIIQEEEGFNVYMDRTSSLYLKGVKLDYEKDISKMGFKFDNPSAKNTCGCSKSFSI